MSGGSRIVHVPRPSRVSGYLAARLGPPVIEPSTVREVLHRYGLRPAGVSLNLRLGRRSRNVAVATGAGRKVVKLYRPQWTPARVGYAHSLLVRLEDVAFPAPRLLRTAEGATWAGVGQGLFAVFEFVPGTNYSMNYLLRHDRLRLTAVAGRTLARFHRCLDGFVPEGEHHLGFDSATGRRRRDIAWHGAKLEELRERSAHLRDEDARALAARLIARAPLLLDQIAVQERALAGARFPRLIIHGDYGLHNLIFQPTGGVVPVDFELSRLDWRLNDLISVLGKHRYRGGFYDMESMEAFLRAYSAEFPLTPDELGLLGEAWRLYKLHAAVQYWNSYFETDGPVRKLASALDSMGQADWVRAHPGWIGRLGRAAGEPVPATEASGRILPAGLSRTP
jgi:Ser/Thr protein kinase RdoA (MazF antagonist)